jgi:hypothetical protein
MIRYSHAMTCLMAYHNKKGTEAISIVLQTRCINHAVDCVENITIGVFPDMILKAHQEYLRGYTQQMAQEILCVLLVKIQHFVEDGIIIMASMVAMIVGMLTTIIVGHFLLALWDVHLTP